jgi:hypothetical protein
LKSQGFKDIVMVADSGGNPPGMIDVANELNAKWKGDPARVFYLPEYYTEDIWSYDYLKQIGIVQTPDVRSATAGTSTTTITTRRWWRCRTRN